MKPLCIDLFCGLGGWADGFLAEGWDVIGFDIERHDYGTGGYPGQLVLQDVLTLHGSQFAGAACIVASPPCQAYSYRAMPWKRAKALPPPDNSLFFACFRLQQEAIAAAGRHIPLAIENVKGAQPWVGPAKAHFGSYYLWGDVENVGGAIVAPRPVFGQVLRGARRVAATKVPGLSFSGYGAPGYKPQGFNVTAAQRYREGVKVASDEGRCTDPGKGARFTTRDCGAEGVKQRGSGPEWFDKALDEQRRQATAVKALGMGGGSKYGAGDPSHYSSGSNSRKAASAMIAKIPFQLASYIARIYRPEAARLEA